ncbi:Stk1 family PASTA domain-containing Ser/Thr kinase [Pediococcus ethanolidurans]|uniref:Stk1 family PASTA domain-containing Ser/Thr kinase n=1 Tax=Pediococcus ethanolidurans TaxID=319653 RepID=UPI001C1EE633|nr:Stk1 family PASTA domain-containing Ser/Thr kinase [Pediococcus ethanolidurans]MBU7554518.1 Stk1 family PASTA domain-containing Ser/Thr kinase [Pediococcus ethanolidurans]MBU7563093.1 Stk1 family PASTA domain-containing Ser/Thr kinase [Pediococcus ethanolidurans]MCT4397185.1 Stk1 family PASTA domain-containing Ser/Thr kinase [Pediococcus ethanolidurans]MCV3315089.1 Stk1 family PASTA domain-containing Ser/Thr kinase [Pediococcus ethanolidurans]MCV3320853.1 Stk1 family PASTA domain-containing
MTPNQTLNGRYRIISPLGEGGMADVYLAHDLILKRNVAVKLLRFDLQNDDKTIQRFQREALSTTELVHPNIVSVYDVGEDNGIHYLVMEYVDGTDLKQYIKDHFPIPYQQVVEVMEQILSGVAAAHAHDIIHRDLKPQNVLMDKRGNAKISDFGVALAQEEQTLTQTNVVVGSVHYLSPEQARGHLATKRSDIYSLGIILYEMLTGRVPFEGENAVSIAIKHYQNQIPFVRDFDPRIPQALENVVLKATAKNPFDRYNSVSEMADDLNTALSVRRAGEKRFVAPSLTDETIIADAAEFQPQTKDVAELKAVSQSGTLETSGKTKKRRSRHPLRKKIAIFAGLLLLFIFGIGMAFYLSFPKVVTIPNVTGMTQAQATAVLKKHDLKVGQITRTGDQNVNYKRVIETLPCKKKQVQAGVAVNVVISQGPNSYVVDNYIGSSYNKIAKKLRAKGFKVTKKIVQTTQFDHNRIIYQSVVPDQVVVPRMTTISFSVTN